MRKRLRGSKYSHPSVRRESRGCVIEIFWRDRVQCCQIFHLKITNAKYEENSQHISKVYRLAGLKNDLIYFKVFKSQKYARHLYFDYTLLILGKVSLYTAAWSPVWQIFSRLSKNKLGSSLVIIKLCSVCKILINPFNQNLIELKVLICKTAHLATLQPT